MSTETFLQRRALLTAVLVLTLPLAAHAERVPGSGRSSTESRALAAFQAVALSGDLELRVRQGPEQRVEVTADDNLLPYLETEVRGSAGEAQLVLRWKRGAAAQPRSRAQVSVTMPRLTALSASGSGDMIVERFETPALALRIAGSSNTLLRDLAAGRLEIGITGSGDVQGTGSAEQLAIRISGRGDVDLAELKAETATVSIAGSGDVRVQPRASLEVRIAGSGEVRYRGEPAKVSARVAGSGDVRKE